MDIVLFREGLPDFTPKAYEPFGIYWRSLGGIWGGDFKPLGKDGVGWDPVHFEFTK